MPASGARMELAGAPTATTQLVLATGLVRVANVVLASLRSYTLPEAVPAIDLICRSSPGTPLLGVISSPAVVTKYTWSDEYGLGVDDQILGIKYLLSVSNAAIAPPNAWLPLLTGYVKTSCRTLAVLSNRAR